MPTLEIDDADLDVLLRVQRQRQLRELTCHVRFPVVPEDKMGRIRATAQQEAFHFTCICDREIRTSSRIGDCPSCGREYDLRHWGN